MNASMTGNDALKVDDRILADFADGEVVGLTYPNDIANVKTGKNGNAIFALNESGRQCDVVLRVLRASDDDKYLQSRFDQQKGDFAAFSTIAAEFTKRVGDGSGNVDADVYTLAGGIFQKRVETKMQVEGDVEQSVAIYHLKFANGDRKIT